MLIWHEKPAWQPPPDSGSQEVAALVQTAFVHVSPAGQTSPHEPQLFGSLEVSTHVPLQIAPVHVEDVHVPAVQLCPARQTWPHAPQLLGSLEVSTHVPLQSAPLHEAMHAPAMQLSPAGHTSPHNPQLFGSL